MIQTSRPRRSPGQELQKIAIFSPVKEKTEAKKEERKDAKQFVGALEAEWLRASTRIRFSCRVFASRSEACELYDYNSPNSSEFRSIPRSTLLMPVRERSYSVLDWLFGQSRRLQLII
ncbi:hypothetical protein KFK09_006674 [Dendrobium nobile]|uniref:Uncharacterized protein n=1 Tax=Dendrobium nobile TaxID=94219 RepID=A0A8T3BPW5_DENNO|nr:hypothetical protein KFK09_006674 [Dendrobium nobile]